MKRNTYVVCLLLLAVIACKNDKSICYLIGTIDNSGESEWLYLREFNSGILKDSFLAENGEFNCKLSLSHPVKFLLHNKRNRYDFRDRKIIWLEPAEIKINGDFSFIKNFQIKGSPSQTEYETYTQIFENYDNQINALKEQIHFVSNKKAVVYKMDSLASAQKKEVKDYLQSHKNSLVTLSVLHYESYSAKRYLTKTDLNEIFTQMPGSLKNSEQGQEIDKYIHLPEVPKVGEQALEIIQLTPQGDTVRLSDFRGSYVLVDFWSSWCGPCRAAHKNLRKYYKKYREAGLEILSVSGDNNKEQWIKAIAEDSLVWTNVSDLKGWKNEAFLQYDVKMIPSKILIDKEGKILNNQILCSKSWELELAELLNVKKL